MTWMPRTHVKSSQKTQTRSSRSSHRIHADPELKFEEERSSAWTADVLADAGLAGRHRVSANSRPRSPVEFGNGPLHLAICAEYDALPGIGHACGHNIIAATAVGAGLALAPLVDELGLTVTVIGTPAEEGGGGKVLLLERGAFDGVHAAMMVHPAPLDDMLPARERGRTLRGSVHRSRIARRRRARARRQRRRRVHRRAGRDRAAAPAPPRRRAGPRCRAPRRGRSQHRPCAHRRALDGPGPHRRRAGRPPAARASLLRGGRARDRRAARHRTRRARLRADGARHRARRPVPAQRARPRSARRGRRAHHVLDRHGQRLARDSVDPPVHRDRHGGCRQPSARVHGCVHQRVGGPGRPRGIARDGVDRDRHRDRPARATGCCTSS